MLATGQRTHFHNIFSRNIFPFSMEDVVLYLPMWQEDTQGSPIISYDQYHHSCTPSGAVYTLNRGRFFDGGGAADDLITVPAHSAISNLFSGGGTLVAWIDIASGGEGGGGRIAYKDEGSVGWYFAATSEAGGKTKLQILQRLDGGGGNLFWNTDNTVVTNDRPTMVAVTYNSAAHTNDPIIYVVDSVGGFTVPALTKGGTGTGSRTDDSAVDLIIGNTETGSLTLDGYIMELAAWSIIQTADALEYYYNQTRRQHE